MTSDTRHEIETRLLAGESPASIADDLDLDVTTNPVEPRRWMIEDLVEALAQSSEPKLIASSHPSEDELFSAALEHIRVRLTHGEPHTDDEAEDAALEYAAREWASWMKAEEEVNRG